MSRILTMAIVAMMPLFPVSVAFSQSCQDCGISVCNPCDSTANLFCTRGPVTDCGCCGKGSLRDKIAIYGWVQAGISLNGHGSRNLYTGAPNAPCSRQLDMLSGNSYLLMSKEQSDFSVYQTWLGVKKELDAKHGLDWGFQMDTLFGTDAKFGQCFGDQTFDYGWGTGDYDLSIVQAFGEVGYRNLKFRAGKFATGMTHEALPAIATFFHTIAYTCYNLPLTVTGVTAEYKAGRRLSFSGGWTAGCHNSFTNRFNDAGFLGRAGWSVTDNMNLAYNIYAGKSYGFDKRADAARFGRDYGSASHAAHSLICTVNLGKKWLYVIEGVFADNNYQDGRARWRSHCGGINQHLIHTINKAWAVGLRGDWSNNHGTLFDIPPVSGGEGGDLYAISLGANWTPNTWFILRPEIRYDWSNYYNGFQPFANGTQANQLTAGGSFIVKF